ncbi:predicted protein [Plenodomus lingam JN3]|uniref:Predicted protein n=1 Tax=Leptosphaeria maculans (strain JN3 / isolate v23.1.3 / race Av1-4-5-6-7-8) TaxID=985895 RepID=E5ABI0_LEPMJ|nr:predicted protein [Plenodomus lingam JN3]CBY01021.1 predicted protein [Plenodomus lingam JN3]
MKYKQHVQITICQRYFTPVPLQLRHLNPTHFGYMETLNHGTVRNRSGHEAERRFNSRAGEVNVLPRFQKEQENIYEVWTWLETQA